MFCKFCGSKIDDNSIFCNKCGKNLNDNIIDNIIQKHEIENTEETIQDNNAPIIQDTTQKNNTQDLDNTSTDNSTTATNPQIVKAKKILTITMISLLCVIGIEGIIYGSYSSYNSSSVGKYMQFVKQNNVISANNMYYSNLCQKSSNIEKVTDSLNTYLNSIKEDIVSGAKTYEECMENIQTVNSLGIESIATSIQDTSNYIQEINRNNSAISQGDEAFSNMDYINAINIYSNVDESNPKYSEVQTKIEKSKELLISQTQEKSKELINAGDYIGNMNLINTVLEIIPENSTLLELKQTADNTYKSYYIDVLISNAENSISSEDSSKIVNAVKNIYNCFNIYPESVGEKSLVDSYNSCINAISKKVKKLIEDKNIDEANTLIGSTLNAVGDNGQNMFKIEQSDLAELVKEYINNILNEDLDYDGSLKYLAKLYNTNPYNTEIQEQYLDMYENQEIFSEEWIGTVETKSGNGIILREIASINGNDINIIPDGAKVTVKEKFGAWYIVEYKEQTGYVQNKFVKNYQY